MNTTCKKILAFLPPQKMKPGYKIILYLLFCVAIILISLSYLSWLGCDTQAARLIQILTGLSIAVTAIIALSNTDPRRDSIKVCISKLPILDDKQSWGKNQLSRDLQSTFGGFPVNSHRVHFKMNNTSGFDLIKPVFTFKLPLEKRPPYPIHPKEGEKCLIRSFTWNLSGSGEALIDSSFSKVTQANVPIPYI